MKKTWKMMMLAVLLILGSVQAAALEYTLEDESSEIALIQNALLSLDFYYGDITGHYGERTQRGIRLFQEEYGLEPTGVADDETRARLYQVTGVTPPPISQTLLETNTTLRRGDVGSAVTWLQESLTMLGYYEGEITGSYGMLTHEAVRKFQRADGLSGDGVAGRNTIQALAQAIEAREQADKADSVQDAEGMLEEQETITTLTLGMENSAVGKLQEDLTQLGFYTGVVTGRYGRLTKEAVRLFQRANDIPSDGVAGPVTLAEIEDEMNGLRALENALLSPALTPTPDPYNELVTLITPAPANTQESDALQPEVVTPAPAYTPIIGVHSSVGFLSIERELQLYDASEDVRQLQIALSSLGYYNGSASGYFDLQTKAAVMGYQAAKTLSMTGVADKVTLITINDDIFRRLVGSID